ncbi:MAG: hypothetical protein H7831_17410, partial [Magnetococcus sp. WYHC-3]
APFSNRPAVPSSSLATQSPVDSRGEWRQERWHRLVQRVHRQQTPLAIKLENHVRCLHLEEDPVAGTLVLRLRLVSDLFGAPQQLAERLRALFSADYPGGVTLDIHGAEAWALPGEAETLAERDMRQRRIRKRQLEQQVRAHPAVQRLVGRLAGRLLDVCAPEDVPRSPEIGDDEQDVR